MAVALHHQFTGDLTGALSVMRRAARNLALANDHAFGVRIDRLRPALNNSIHASWNTMAIRKHPKSNSSATQSRSQ